MRKSALRVLCLFLTSQLSICSSTKQNQRQARGLSVPSACGEPTDACMNKDNWANCVALHETGCENILVLESCPLQFACEDKTNNSNSTDFNSSKPESGTSSAAAASVCGDRTDDCMNKDNWAQCKALEDEGCQNIVRLESCPLQFQCGDASQAVCGEPTGACMNEDNWAECKALEDSGCRNIIYLDSCPVQFACGDDATTPSVCGNPTDACMNEDNWAECKALEDEGCQNIFQLESCPVQFACGDDATTPSVCGEPTDACMNEDNWAQCKTLEDSGCQTIIHLDSCPLKFACVDITPWSKCGEPTDECMNKENWAECKRLERNGCQNLLIQESCPLIFACGDISNGDGDVSVNSLEEASGGVVENGGMLLKLSLVLLIMLV